MTEPVPAEGLLQAQKTESVSLHDAFMNYYDNHAEGSKFVIVAPHRIACIDVMFEITHNIESWIPVKLNDSLKWNRYEIQFPHFHIVARSPKHTFNDTMTDENDTFISILNN